MTALALEPQFEAGARAEDQAVQELVAETGKRDRLRPGAPGEDVDIDERSGWQRETEWIAAEFRVVAEPAAQRRECPAQGSQRVVRLREEQAREPLARWGQPSA